VVQLGEGDMLSRQYEPYRAEEGDRPMTNMALSATPRCDGEVSPRRRKSRYVTEAMTAQMITRAELRRRVHSLDGEVEVA